MIVRTRNTFIILIVAVAAMSWGFDWPFGWPNPKFGNEERGRLVTLVALGSNDTLTVTAEVSTVMQGLVLDEHATVVGDNHWEVDIYLQEGDKIHVHFAALVAVERRGDHGTVTVKITDNGKEVRKDGPNRPRSGQTVTGARVSYGT